MNRLITSTTARARQEWSGNFAQRLIIAAQVIVIHQPSDHNMLIRIED
jgi:hypothetical protein